MGLVTTGNSAGGIVYPIVVRQLMPKVSSIFENQRTSANPAIETVIHDLI